VVGQRNPVAREGLSSAHVQVRFGKALDFAVALVDQLAALVVHRHALRFRLQGADCVHHVVKVVPLDFLNKLNSRRYEVG